jgi:hypothetical protein
VPFSKTVEKWKGTTLTRADLYNEFALSHEGLLYGAISSYVVRSIFVTFTSQNMSRRCGVHFLFATSILTSIRHAAQNNVKGATVVTTHFAYTYCHGNATANTEAKVDVYQEMLHYGATDIWLFF